MGGDHKLPTDKEFAHIWSEGSMLKKLSKVHAYDEFLAAHGDKTAAVRLKSEEKAIGDLKSEIATFEKRLEGNNSPGLVGVRDDFDALRDIKYEGKYDGVHASKTDKHGVRQDFAVSSPAEIAGIRKGLPKEYQTQGFAIPASEKPEMDKALKAAALEDARSFGLPELLKKSAPAPAR